MAVTFFGAASNPTTTNGSNSASPTAIVPPGSMLAGDLVVVACHNRLTNDMHAVSNAGGQSWTKLTTKSDSSGLLTTTTWFWCRFNGTWTANPSFSHGGTCNTCMMVVFRPTTTGHTWIMDVAQVTGQFAAPATPFDVTIAGISTLTDGAVVVASWSSRDDNTWALQTAGWTSDGTINNLAGSDGSDLIAHKIMPTHGASGNVVGRETANGGDTGVSYIAAWKEMPPISGSASITQDANGISATGTIANAPISGALAEEEAAETISAEADLEIRATLAISQAGDTVAGAGKLAIAGAATITQADQSLAAAGHFEILASLSKQQADNTISASAKLAVAGSLSEAQGADQVVTEGDLAITGSLGATQEGETSAGQAGLAIHGSLTTQQTDQTVAAAGTLSAIPQAFGALDSIQADNAITASGKLALIGMVIVTQDAQVLSANGNLGIPSIAGALAETQAGQQLTAESGLRLAAALAEAQESQAIAASGGNMGEIAGRLSIIQDSQSVDGDAVLGPVFVHRDTPDHRPVLPPGEAYLTGDYSEWQFSEIQKWVHG